MSNNPQVQIPQQGVDRNRLTAFQLANNVSLNVVGRELHDNVNPSKKLIYNLLNLGMRKVATASPYLTYLNATMQMNGYDYNSSPLPPAIPNFSSTEYGLNEGAGWSRGHSTFVQTTPRDIYIAQSINNPTTKAVLSSLTFRFIYDPIPAVPSVGTFEVAVFANNNTTFPNSPDYTKIIVPWSLPIPLTGYTANTDITVPFTSNIELAYGTTYWVVLKCNGVVQNFLPGVNSAYNTPYPPGIAPIQYSYDGQSFDEFTGQFLWFNTQVIPRNTLYQFDLPLEVESIQRVYAAPLTQNPLLPQYIFTEWPYDKYQQSILGQYDLGYSYFTVRGVDPKTGQKQLILPRGMNYDTLYVDYKKKPPILVDDTDYPDFPADYLFLLEVFATIRLMGLGYGIQQAPLLNDWKEDFMTGIQGFFRDYGPQGEKNVSVVGSIYTPIGDATDGVRTTNDSYWGFTQRGIPQR